MAAPYVNGEFPTRALVYQDGALVAPDVASDLAELQLAYRQLWGKRLVTRRSYMELGKPGDIQEDSQYGANYQAAHGISWFEEPGSSPHGLGRAVDFDVVLGSPQHEWLQQNAGFYNWQPSTTPEQGHYVHP